MLSRARLRVFLFHRTVMFCSRYIQFFLFLIIPWTSASMTPWWVLVHEYMYIFDYLSNYNLLDHGTWSNDRWDQRQYFSKIFWMIWKTTAKFPFNLPTCSYYSITSHVTLLVFHSFSWWTGAIKNAKYQPLKIKISPYIEISSK